MSLFDSGAAVAGVVSEFVSRKTVLAAWAQERYAPAKPARDLFVLREEHLQGLGSDRAKVRANIAAIELVKSAQGRRQLTLEEKSRVAAYSGWGGLSNMFSRNTDYPAEQERLKELLGPQGYASAMESVLTAYYTEPEVIRGIWALVRTLGFAGGRVTEPSCGVGHFIGAMPEDLRQQSRVTMVEIDAITAAMARELYGDSQTIVYACGLEKAPIRPASFDLVVGNVPFGQYRVGDQRLDHLRMNIHDYFFAKCLDALRPGGVLALITSTGTMDKTSTRVRQYLSERANLVTAIRLPSGAFQRLGGTDVVADIVVLQKKAFGAKPAVPFDRVVRVPQCMASSFIPEADVNQFFVANPGNVLGKFVMKKGRFGERLGVVAVADWTQRLRVLCRDGRLAGVFEPAKNVADPSCAVRDGKGIAAAYGYFFAQDGRLVQLDEQQRVHSLSHLPTATSMRLESMARIRDAVDLLEADAVQSPCAADKRMALNARYDEFVRRHGLLMNACNRRVFAADSHAPLLWALESYDEENDTAVKADLFHRPTLCCATLAHTAQTLAQAMALSFNHFARFDAAFVAQALGRETGAVLEELIAADEVYLDPERMQWVDKETYLSGHVYEKRARAQAGDARFERNVRALQAIVPLTSVALRLGVPWIGAGYIEQFVRDLLEIDRADDGFMIEVTHLPTAASWTVQGQVKHHYAANTQWATSRKKFHVLLSDMLNQKSIEVHDEIQWEGAKPKRVLNGDETMAAREKAQKIQQAFERWVFEDEARLQALQDTYNRIYNGHVNRKFDGSHLVIPGLNPAIELRASQKDAIWRGLVGGNTLFAHAAGGGKTLIQICLSHEAKRLAKRARWKMSRRKHFRSRRSKRWHRAIRW